VRNAVKSERDERFGVGIMEARQNRTLHARGSKALHDARIQASLKAKGLGAESGQRNLNDASAIDVQGLRGVETRLGECC
jgi:hypothetical protein